MIVQASVAVSVDGYIDDLSDRRLVLSHAADWEEVRSLRAESDAILVGIGTVIADDPELTVRLPGMEDRSPLRIVLDRDLRLPLTSRLVQTAKVVPVIAVGSRIHGVGYDERRAALEAAGVEVIETGSLPELLALLGERGINGLMVEGGAVVADAFLKAGLVDAIALYEGPGEIGAEGIASPLTRAHIGPEFRFLGESRFGPDRRFDYERID